MCDEIAAHDKVETWDEVMSYMNLVARHSERSVDVEQCIFLLNEIAYKFDLK